MLSSAGHIAGIVNPPSPKAKLWTNDTLPADPEDWFRGATLHAMTWWNDWAEWIVDQSGPQLDARVVGGGTHHHLCAAPGTYVTS